MSDGSGGCPERVQLFKEFKERLNVYHLSLAPLAGTAIVSPTAALYQACLSARRTLELHDREHGCFFEALPTNTNL